MTATTMIALVVLTSLIIYSKSYSIKETANVTEYQPKMNILQRITTIDDEVIEEKYVDALSKCKIQHYKYFIYEFLNTNIRTI